MPRPEFFLAAVAQKKVLEFVGLSRYQSVFGVPLSCVRPLLGATSVAIAAISVGACGRSGGPSADAGAQPSSSAAPSASAPFVMNATPFSEDSVRQQVNPKNEQPYSGPTGTVRGVVSIKGDPPPVLAEVVEKIPDKCKPARAVYGRLFREGMVRSLADVLVTVTEYQGFVPAKGQTVILNTEGCAFPGRTIALTYGQRIDVLSKDGEPYVPKLMGGQMRADMIAVPGGSAVKLYPHVPGRYTLIDQMHLFMTADVFVLKYATFDVTGLDGKFEISGVPVGEVSVNALLPSIMATTQQKVKVEEGKTVELNLELEFDAKKLEKPKKPPKVKIH